ncbi:MAG: hypothetical protein ABI540_09110 [Spartobacteria bacterium]
MKAKLLLLTLPCITAAVLSVSPACAKVKGTPAPDASASSEASAVATAKSARPVAYRGKVASVDLAAKIFTVGKHTIKVTDETKITKLGAAGTMADVVVDEEVRGSYWKKAEGVLEAKSVKLGPKSGASAAVHDDGKKATDAQKKDGQAIEKAVPSASPKP